MNEWVTPDAKYISTSFLERQNLSMLVGMVCFTRLTNGFSKKLEKLRTRSFVVLVVLTRGCG